MKTRQLSPSAWEPWAESSRPRGPECSHFSQSASPISVSLSFAGDKKIIELNSRYRKINLPTNVLSFPSFIEGNKEIFLGDIIFSAETIFKEAKRDKKSFNDHLIHLFIHSVLHLVGYDHQTENKAKIMESLEISILETLKINNPYK